MNQSNEIAKPFGYLSKDQWSPYTVGVLIGILAWIVFGAMHETIGVTSSFVHAAAYFESLFSIKYVEQLAYYKKEIGSKPLFSWQVAFVIGIFLGSLLASLTSMIFTKKIVPKTWSNQFGPSVTKRYLGAFIGGLILMYGARMAGGCTSGHGISGTLQLAVSSWAFIIAVFAIGIPFAFLFYKPK